MDQNQSCASWKFEKKSAVCLSALFILFVEVAAILLIVYFFLWVLTHLPNIFAPYIKNFETYYAILFHFDFGYVLYKNYRVLLEVCSSLKNF